MCFMDHFLSCNFLTKLQSCRQKFSFQKKALIQSLISQYADVTVHDYGNYEKWEGNDVPLKE